MYVCMTCMYVCTVYITVCIYIYGCVRAEFVVFQLITVFRTNHELCVVFADVEI